MNNPLQERFSDLLHRHVHRLRVIGSKATGLCPFHQERTPSFSADIERGVWHCFGCGIGGGVKRFAELTGEPWGSTYSENLTVRVHRTALAVAREEYNRWQREKLIELTDKFRELSAEREIAEIAYRAIQRNSALLSEEERRLGIGRLGTLYDQLAVLEYKLDILAYREHEKARFELWCEEKDYGRL